MGVLVLVQYLYIEMAHGGLSFGPVNINIQRNVAHEIYSQFYFALISKSYGFVSYIDLYSPVLFHEHWGNHRGKHMIALVIAPMPFSRLGKPLKWYLWLSARLQYLPWECTGDTAVLH